MTSDYHREIDKNKFIKDPLCQVSKLKLTSDIAIPTLREIMNTWWKVDEGKEQPETKTG